MGEDLGISLYHLFYDEFGPLTFIPDVESIKPMVQ